MPQNSSSMRRHAAAFYILRIIVASMFRYPTDSSASAAYSQSTMSMMMTSHDHHDIGFLRYPPSDAPRCSDFRRYSLCRRRAATGRCEESRQRPTMMLACLSRRRISAFSRPYSIIIAYSSSYLRCLPVSFSSYCLFSYAHSAHADYDFCYLYFLRF